MAHPGPREPPVIEARTGSGDGRSARPPGRRAENGGCRSCDSDRSAVVRTPGRGGGRFRRMFRVDFVVMCDSAMGYVCFRPSDVATNKMSGIVGKYLTLAVRAV